jgi:hypothetical protein
MNGFSMLNILTSSQFYFIWFVRSRLAQSYTFDIRVVVSLFHIKFNCLQQVLDVSGAPLGFSFGCRGCFMIKPGNHCGELLIHCVFLVQCGFISHVCSLSCPLCFYFGRGFYVCLCAITYMPSVIASFPAHSCCWSWPLMNVCFSIADTPSYLLFIAWSHNRFNFNGASELFAAIKVDSYSCFFLE